MEEDIAGTMQKGAEALHFFGLYRLCNALIVCGRAARALKLTTLEELTEWVEEIEAEASEADALGRERTKR